MEAKILLVGASGKMGRMIAELVPDEIVCGVDQIEDENEKFKIYSSFNQIPADLIKEVNVIVDFSNQKGFKNTIDFASEHKIPLVVGTTGLTEDDYKLAEAEKDVIPILLSTNMSVGINAILKNIAGFINDLGDNFDIEIVEKHHNQKVDAPSGTALTMAETINTSTGKNLKNVYDRSNVRKPRDKDEIGIVSVRAGTLPGEHSIIIAGIDEVIEVKHTAYSRKIFANGAIRAADWIISQPPGLYTYQDILIND